MAPEPFFDHLSKDDALSVSLCAFCAGALLECVLSALARVVLLPPWPQIVAHLFVLSRLGVVEGRRRKILVRGD